MKRSFNPWRVGCLLAAAIPAAALLVGCDQMDGASVGAVSVTEDPLYTAFSPGVAAAGLWPNGAVPVCFSNVSPTAAYSKMLRNEIESKWGRYGNVRFTGWGACPSGNPGNVVRINNESGGTGPRSDVGRKFADGVAVPTDMYLYFSRWSGCGGFLWFGASDDECFRYTAVHEFGHALGFFHEQARTDTPSSCTESDHGDLRSGIGMENPFLTAYDPDSVMNYCNHHWNNDGELSAVDIIGLQALYGRKAPGSMVGRGGRNLDVPYGNTSPGTNLWIFENNGSTPQQWSYNVADGTFRALGMCLDDPSGNHADASQTTIQNCATRATSRWDFQDVVIRALGEKCLDRVGSGTANGTLVQLFYCTGNGNQRWTYTAAGELRTGPGGSAAKCLDTYPGGNGFQLRINDCFGDDYEKFDLTAQGEIRARAGRKCFDVANFSKADHAAIQLFDCKSDTDSSPSTAHMRLNQMFNFTADSKFHGSGGKCLDAFITDISVNGIPAKVNGCNGYKNQVWDYYFKP